MLLDTVHTFIRCIGHLGGVGLANFLVALLPFFQEGQIDPDSAVAAEVVARHSLEKMEDLYSPPFLLKHWLKGSEGCDIGGLIGTTTLEGQAVRAHSEFTPSTTSLTSQETADSMSGEQCHKGFTAKPGTHSNLHGIRHH